MRQIRWHVMQSERPHGRLCMEEMANDGVRWYAVEECKGVELRSECKGF